ncbi:MAG: hypothetical protein ACM32E_00060 [Gemmatimonadota bacterium]
MSLVGGLSITTPLGRDITTAVVRFLLFYGGVFALIAMTAAVGIGLVATDRIVMSPGHRVTAQAIHRAVSLGALAFLVIHILLEIAAERSQAIDAVVPFLAQGRTFYIGIGTIASDLILLVVASGFLRPRFARSRRPWMWRAVHTSAYLSWVLSILHGLLGGRTAKPYVDWSYGACIAAVALALAIRMVATSRSREEVALAAGDEASYRSPWPSLPPALAGAGSPQLMLGLPSAPALPAGPSSLSATARDLPAAGGLHPGTGLHATASLPAGTGRAAPPLTEEPPWRAGPADDPTDPRLGRSPAWAGLRDSSWDAAPVEPGGPGGPGGLGRHRAAAPAWDALGPDNARTDPGIPAASEWSGIRAFDDRPRPGNSPGSVWVGIRQPDAVSPPGEPWGHLRPQEDPWADLQSGYPYPRGGHHRPEPDSLPEGPPGGDGMPRRGPRIAGGYGGGYGGPL